MEQSFSLRSLWHTIKRAARLILGMSVLGAVLGAGYAAVAPKTYTASSSVVLGGYAVPSSIAMQGGLVGSGPLGLELPPETMVTLATSPVVSALAVKEDPSIGTAEDVSDATSVEAPTTNTLAISATGNTAELAAARGNAMGEAVLAFRREQAARQLERNDKAIGQAVAARAARVKEIDTLLKSQKASPETQGLINERDELSKANASAETDRANLKGFVDTFDGGAVVDRPALPRQAVKNPNVVTSLVVGLVLGLLASLAGVVLRAAMAGRLSGDESEAAGRAVEGDDGIESVGYPRRNSH